MHYRKSNKPKKQKAFKGTMHSYYLELVKKITGASFISWIVNPDGVKNLKIVLNGNEKIIGFTGEITEETYTDMIDKLLGKTPPEEPKDSVKTKRKNKVIIPKPLDEALEKEFKEVHGEYEPNEFEKSAKKVKKQASKTEE